MIGISFDSVILTDLGELSYTAMYVDENVPFYFRVSAINPAGAGTPTISTPQFAVPTARTFSQ